MERRRAHDPVIDSLDVHVENIHTDITELGERIADMNVQVIKLNNLRILVGGMHKSLYGDDGCGGIAKRTTVCEERVEDESEARKSMVSWMKWGIPIANGIVLLIIGVLFRLTMA